MAPILVLGVSIGVTLAPLGIGLYLLAMWWEGRRERKRLDRQWARLLQSSRKGQTRVVPSEAHIEGNDLDPREVWPEDGQ